MSKEQGNRDRDGKLISYSKPSCSFGEVLAVRIDERMQRMESNVADARIEVGTLSDKMEKLTLQMTTVCGETRGLMNEVRIFVLNQEKKNDNIEDLLFKSKKIQGIRLTDIEKHVTFMRNLGKISVRTIVIGVPVAGLILGLIKFFEGRS